MQKPFCSALQHPLLNMPPLVCRYLLTTSPPNINPNPNPFEKNFLQDLALEPSAGWSVAALVDRFGRTVGWLVGLRL